MAQHTLCSVNITGNNWTRLENHSSILNISITNRYQTFQSNNDQNDGVDDHALVLTDITAPPIELRCELPLETLIMPEFLDSYLLDEVFYYLDLDRDVMNYFEQRIVSAFIDLVEKTGWRAGFTVNADLVLTHVYIVPAEELASCSISEDAFTYLPVGGTVDLDDDYDCGIQASESFAESKITTELYV